MKRTLLSAIAVIALALSTFAQDNFKLTAAGFVSEADPSKDYLVFEVPGQSKADLFKRMLLHLNKQFTNPKEALSTVDGESITVNGLAQAAVKMKVLYLNPAWDVNYTLSFQFKDGKIRASQPFINRMRTQTGYILRTASIAPDPGSGQYHKSIFNKSGKASDEKAVAALEGFINAAVNSAVAGAKAADDNW